MAAGHVIHNRSPASGVQERVITTICTRETMLTPLATRLISFLNPLVRLCVALGIGLFLLDQTVGVSYLLDKSLDNAVSDSDRRAPVVQSSATLPSESDRNKPALSLESINRTWAQRQAVIRDAGARTAGTAIGICGCVWIASCAVVPMFMIFRRLN